MATPTSTVSPETRSGYWRRVLRPLFWWLLLVLAMFGYHQHELAMERTRIKFSVFLQGVDATFATSGRLDGRPVSIGQKIGLGNHTLTLVNPKAEPFITNFFCWYGGRDFGQINLKRTMGTLSVTARPAASTISIAGPEFSLTLTNSTGTNLTVPSDTYDIRAEYPHWSQVRNPTVFDRQTAACAFTPQFGALHLTCNHDGATYQLQQMDGRTVDSGNLPTIITGLPSDRYQITVGYHHRQMQRTVFLKPDLTNEVPFEFLLGAAHLESTPPGAAVESAEGGYLGQTPLDVPDLTPQTAQFNLSLSGYVPVSVTLAIAADQTNVCRTNLLSIGYVSAMREARDSLAVTNYNAVVRATGEALNAKPGDTDAIALQNKANEQLGFERQKLEQSLRPKKLFEDLCGRYTDAGLFPEHELMTVTPAKAVAAAIAQSFQAAPVFESAYSQSPDPQMYVMAWRQSFSLGILGGNERDCLMVVGQAKANETQIWFKVLQYQIQHTVVASGLSLHDNKQYIPVCAGRIQMTAALEEELGTGMRIVREKLQQAIGQ